VGFPIRWFRVCIGVFLTAATNCSQRINSFALVRERNGISLFRSSCATTISSHGSFEHHAQATAKACSSMLLMASKLCQTCLCSLVLSRP
jgi:hypothetical protein